MSNSSKTLTRKQPFSALRAALTDGRFENVRYRQDQLQRLHRLLTSSIQEVVDALVQDTGCTRTDACLEVSLALTCLRQHYDSLDFDSTLQNEYQVTHGQDYKSKRVAVGIVHIKPRRSTPFYSLIAPLSAAIASGNGIVLELDTSLLTLPAFFRKNLSTVLDPDLIALTNSQADDIKTLPRVLRVEETTATSIPEQLIALPSAQRSVAVVDRTANLTSAAKDIVRARFSFNGNSPYAPDIVLVNEFVKKQFLDATVQEAIKYTSEQSIGSETSQKRELPKDRTLANTIEKLSVTEKADVILSSDRAAVLSLPKRNLLLQDEKIQSPILLVATISSLDDAIDLLNSTNGGKPYLATYVFGSEGATKYLSQFIEANASFLGHIPQELLVGPAAPASYPLDPLLRFTTDMFSVPRPQFVVNAKPTTSNGKAGTKILTSTGGEQIVTLEEAAKPLKPIGQSVGGQIGFFEQGILTGLAVFVLPVLVSAVGVSIFAGRLAYNRLIVG